MAKGVRKVLMTTDAVGGVWTYCMELARALGGQGVEVVLATLGPSPDERQRREAGALGNVTSRESLYRLEWMDEPWGDVERAGEWLLGLEEEFRPDVVHLNGYVHGGLGWRAPVMVVAHSCVLSWWRAVKGEEAPGRYGRYREMVARGLRGADVVVAPSHAMAEAVVGHYGPIGNVKVIANGRDRGLFRPLTKEPIVLAAGRIWDEAKNVAALDAVAGRVGWPVYVAGDEGEKKGGGARRLGRLSTGEMAEWLGRAAIYALPARYEPFGLSVLEAAMAGCALVLGDIPSLRENWSGAAAFVRPYDHEALAATINRLAGDGGRRGALAELARERAREFSPGRMAGAYMATYREMVGTAGEDDSMQRQQQATGRDTEAGPVMTITRMASTSLERR